MKVKTSYTRKWFLKAEVNYLLVFRLQDRSLLESSSSYFTVVRRVTTEVSGPRGSAIFSTLSSRRVEICATTVLSLCGNLRIFLLLWFCEKSKSVLVTQVPKRTSETAIFVWILQMYKLKVKNSIYCQFLNDKIDFT